jgi:hypothetical protein
MWTGLPNWGDFGIQLAQTQDKTCFLAIYIPNISTKHENQSYVLHGLKYT